MELSPQERILLTQTQQAVLLLQRDGRTNKEIAKKLNLKMLVVYRTQVGIKNNLRFLERQNAK